MSRGGSSARLAPADRRSLRTVLLHAWLSAAVAYAWIEPYPPLSGGNFSGPSVPLSPDPLVSYVWDAGVNRSCLQIYTLPALNVTLLDGTFGNLASVTTPLPNVTVSTAGAFMVDFGTESAAWLEFDSLDLQPADLPLITLSISEYTQPAIIGASPKTAIPVAYGNTYRLELNSELYEGVRYAWFNISAAPGTPFTITRLEAMCQTRPSRYSGSFSIGNDTLTSIWYAAVYTVKLNLEESYIGAILMDRGDRISWTGDAHVAQAAVYVALDAVDLAQQNLISTSTSSNGIASYSLYFILSALDYWHATGDNATVAALGDNIIGKLNASQATVAGNGSLAFFGWDDRTGSGFQDATAYQPSWQYRMLALRVWQEVGALLTAIGRSADAAYWAQQAAAYVAGLQASYGSSWWAALGLGMHAAGDAVNALVLPANETQAVMAALFADPVTRCSLSNFNNYWLLQAYANAGWLDEGAAAVAQCWGAELALGGTTFWEISSPEWTAWMQPGDAVPNGYVLFSFNGSGVDVANLPSYVASVAPKFGSFISDRWNGSTPDVRALQSPFASDRALGCYATSMGGDPTFPIDITLQPASEGQWYRVALYFVDWDLRGRRQSVDMLAASDLSRVAPWMPVGEADGTAGFTQGVWLQYAFNASARFRLYQSRGDNAVISAVMFDAMA